MSENSQAKNDSNIDESDEMGSYKKHALSVVNFKLVYDKQDLNAKQGVQFKPDMAHQIFGESELIFGYRSLSITLHYLHNSCNCYIDIQSSGKIQRNNLQADDIIKCMKPWLPDHFATDQSKFLSRLKKENHEFMYGKVLDEFEDKEQVKYFDNREIFGKYKITQADVNDENFKKFHARFETFIIWFIDGANFIDLSDEKWLIFYVYEEFKHPDTNKLYRTPVGFCSAYKFFFYPSNVRTRISQFFVLPSHQRRGIGTRLYDTVVKTFRNMPDVVDITVEEPTSAFQKIRDINDCQTIHEELKKSKLNFFTTSSKKIFEILKKQKICKRQCQRIYDILGSCYSYERGSSEYKQFIDNIKKRLIEEAEREFRPSKRFCNLERAAFTAPLDKTVHIEGEFKRYLDDIEPSVKYLKSHIKNCS